ncbi:ribosomal-processing cysteine protease Prp [Ruminococcaceae bacterium OttesenSCG-928-L11]|nr:ribosomal-processing cysteine protease Prp [Ruminococcaceae bacterium OttesenSCG-928-L11]
MIQAVFRRRNGTIHGVTVSGHAGYADSGDDIVCAAVTSAVQLTANGLTEVLHSGAHVRAGDNIVEIDLPPNAPGGAFLDALRLHMELLAEEYEDYLTITFTEV